MLNTVFEDRRFHPGGCCERQYGSRYRSARVAKMLEIIQPTLAGPAMLLRSATQNQSSVSCSRVGTSPAEPARYTGRQAITTARAGTTHVKSLPDTLTHQHKRQRLITDTVSRPVLKPAETRAIQCKKLFQLTVDQFSTHDLNADHSRLIVQNLKTKQTQVWQAGQSGSFDQSFVFDFNVAGQYEGQQDPNILFVPSNCKVTTNPIHVYERKASGKWVKTQEFTMDDLVRDPGHVMSCFDWFYATRIAHSNDSSSVVCLTKGKYGAILGREADGLWMNRGSCMQYGKAVFSADSNQIALTRDGKLSLMSKSADGFWSETGGVDLGYGDLQLAFSPDSRHFIAWFEHTGEDYDTQFYDTYGRYDFFLMLFSLDDQGQWAEKQRITKYLSERKAQYPLKAEFSPDGKHLAVCSKFEFEVWTLNEDNCWTPALQATPYQKYRIRCKNYPVINFAADSSVLMVVNNESAEVWALQDSGRWECQHKFCHQCTFWPRISPDAKTIVCETAPGKRGLWQQKDGLWTWQGIEGSINQPRFNRDGSILAFIDPDKESLVLMAPNRNGDWMEKRRLQFQGTVQQFQFHPSGQTLQVTCKPVVDYRREILCRGTGEKEELSFWGLGEI